MSLKTIIVQSFFGKLFSRDKLAFSIVFVFFSLSLFANLIKLQTAPFYVWNLYTDRLPPMPSYSFYEIHYNGDRLLNFRHTWFSSQQMFLSEPLEQYFLAAKNGGSDPWQAYLENHWGRKHPAFRSILPSLYNHPDQYAAFPAWYKRYLAQVTGEQIHTITILQKTVRFEKNGRVTQIASDTVLRIK